MKVSVVIPAFGLEADRWRDRAFGLVFHHLLELGWPVTTGEGASPAAARNDGSLLADQSLGFDVVVFNDADTLVPHDQIREAVRLAGEEPGLVFAFTWYDRLDRSVSEQTVAPAFAFAAPVYQQFNESHSHGCVAISRDCLFAVDGYDERLEAYEDCAFNRDCEQLWPSRRVQGAATHLWHPRIGDPGEPAWEERYRDSRAIWESGAARG